MTLKKSMQKLYLKLVGEATDKNNIAKIISDLADNYSGGEVEAVLLRLLQMLSGQ